MSFLANVSPLYSSRHLCSFIQNLLVLSTTYAKSPASFTILKCQSSPRHLVMLFQVALYTCIPLLTSALSATTVSTNCLNVSLICTRKVIVISVSLIQEMFKFSLLLEQVSFLSIVQMRHFDDVSLRLHS